MPLAVATKTVQNVIDYVQRQFGDESGVQITSTDILRWVNAAQLVIAKQTEYSQEIATTTSVANQDAYSLPGVNILVIKSIYYNGKPLDHMSFNDFQENVLGNLTGNDPTIATPLIWYVWKNSIYLWPTPVTSGVEIKLYFIKQPAELTLISETLTVPDQHWSSVIQFVMSQAYELDDDLQGSSFKAKQLKDELESFEKDPSQQYYPTITTLDEDSGL